MILKSFKNFLGLLIIFLLISPLKSEEKIEIWKNKKGKKNSQSENLSSSEVKTKINLKSIKSVDSNQSIKIEDGIINASQEVKVFGIYDPEDYDFNLNMWSSTKAEDIRGSIKRLKKIKLSKTSSDILDNILLSFSYPPEGMTDEDFAGLKIDWLIENNRSGLIENFLKQNN